MRAIGIDVHRDFCEVAIAQDGAVRSGGKIKTVPQELELFAGSLAPTDRVALEVTGNAAEIARISRASRCAKASRRCRSRGSPGPSLTSACSSITASASWRSARS